MDRWIRVSDEMPPIGHPVICQLQGCSSKQIIEHKLIHVDDDDCSWRTADGNAEVGFDWDVVTWKKTGINCLHRS